MASKTSIKKQSRFVHFYLVAYNALQTLGWIVIFFKLVNFYLSPGTRTLYESVRCVLNIFQNAAVLEVIHAVTGIVRSDPVITAFQVGSRVVVVCGVLMATYSPRDSIGLPLALLAWSVTEIIRYSNYCLSLLDLVPYFLKYLRYTLFIVLYPIGITGELLCIYAASKEVGAGHLYSLEMPNKYNFIFNYQHLLWFLMLLYIPLFPQLYLHMFSQRRKVLLKAKTN
ncbi:very-long-chain (3R)-3-hydroxyacyl-CoA dehydratase hpo-8 [Cylas formicarius]|uniref:very-long-chain (3R)-3-hydroxyacyl-CoA dehydratase hpo-8 n=1 Tax=Cylas formicarius TaxID=197179 RepID=UPI0029586FCB|nr:very-long-chain (3R)-3-hydroxyacyl-CoA dehydratase hpo-8 [Cylas formicarius]